MDILCPFGKVCALGDRCQRANSKPKQEQRWLIRKPTAGPTRGKCPFFQDAVVTHVLKC